MSAGNILLNIQGTYTGQDQFKNAATDLKGIDTAATNLNGSSSLGGVAGTIGNTGGALQRVAFKEVAKDLTGVGEAGVIANDIFKGMGLSLGEIAIPLAVLAIGWKVYEAATKHAVDADKELLQSDKDHIQAQSARLAGNKDLASSVFVLKDLFGESIISEKMLKAAQDAGTLTFKDYADALAQIDIAQTHLDKTNADTVTGIQFMYHNMGDLNDVVPGVGDRIKQLDTDYAKLKLNFTDPAMAKRVTEDAKAIKDMISGALDAQPSADLAAPLSSILKILDKFPAAIAGLVAGYTDLNPKEADEAKNLSQLASVEEPVIAIKTKHKVANMDLDQSYAFLDKSQKGYDVNNNIIVNSTHKTSLATLDAAEHLSKDYVSAIDIAKQHITELKTAEEQRVSGLINSYTQMEAAQKQGINTSEQEKQVLQELYTAYSKKGQVVTNQTQLYAAIKADEAQALTDMLNNQKAYDLMNETEQASSAGRLLQSKIQEDDKIVQEDKKAIDTLTAQQKAASNVWIQLANQAGSSIESSFTLSNGKILFNQQQFLSTMISNLGNALVIQMQATAIADFADADYVGFALNEAGSIAVAALTGVAAAAVGPDSGTTSTQPPGAGVNSSTGASPNQYNFYLNTTGSIDQGTINHIINGINFATQNNGAYVSATSIFTGNNPVPAG